MILATLRQYTSLFLVRLFLYKYKFDCPVLLPECVRHDLPLTPFRRWLSVDTLAVLEAIKKSSRSSDINASHEITPKT